MGSLTVVFLISLVYLRVEPKLKSVAISKATQLTDWKVIIEAKNYTRLSLDEKKLIDQKIQKHLLTGSRDELQRLSDSILMYTSFDRVSIKRITQDKIKISLEIPEPVALIKADKLRYVSANGAIFGSKKETEKTGYVTIDGIFKYYKGNFEFSNTNKLIVPESITSNILQTLELKKLADSEKIEISSIKFNDYRGLALVLEQGAFVSLGHGPYDKKLQRLNNIIKKSEQNNEPISRIELDFAGKAFIQKTNNKQEI